MNFWNLKNVKLLVYLVSDLFLLCPRIELFLLSVEILLLIQVKY